MEVRIWIKLMMIPATKATANTGRLIQKVVMNALRIRSTAAAVLITLICRE